MSEGEYSSEFKLDLAIVALRAAESGHHKLSEMISAAHLLANGHMSREALIETFANMIVDGRYDAAKLGDIGDDPELIKAVADLVKSRVGHAAHQSSLQED